MSVAGQRTTASVPACAPVPGVPSLLLDAVRVAQNSAPRFKVLSRVNRLRDSATIRQTLRQGKHVRGSFTTATANDSIGDTPSQVAFIVPKAVGNSVQRNFVKRRLRSIARQVVTDCLGITFVIRAHPGSFEASFSQLESELYNSLVQLKTRLSKGDQR